jgi:hypothetical protein
MPQASFAMFKVWMRIFKAVRTPSRPFCCWDEAIVETRGGGVRRVLGMKVVYVMKNPRMGGDSGLVTGSHLTERLK